MSISKSINISFLFTTSIIAYTFLNGVSIAKAETPPEIISGLQIKATGRKIEIKPGKLNIKGKLVTVAKKNILKVEPAPVFKVENEALKLSVNPPKKYYRGTKLKGPKTKSGSLVPGSLLIRKTPGGEKLTAGKDYLLVEKFGTLGLSPGSRINANDTVYASYSYSKLRLDTVIINQQGEIKLIKGNAHFNVSLPARLEPGSVRLANIYRPYGAVEVKKEHIYPLLESATQAKTLSSSGRIPRTLAKLKSGKKVKIVCWGDSVTAGGDASSGKHRYVNVFSAGLRKKFPNADIEVINISLGGSNIRQWLQIDNFRYRRKMPTGRECDFQRVLNEKADLVTIEFVNDAGVKNGVDNLVNKIYLNVIKRLNQNGTEVILITPHFTSWRMEHEAMRGPETRDYVLLLRALAEKHKIAIADASARWEHLWQEGIPFFTMLNNSINHPEDRGHLIFAEELLKCFD